MLVWSHLNLHTSDRPARRFRYTLEDARGGILQNDVVGVMLKDVVLHFEPAGFLQARRNAAAGVGGRTLHAWAIGRVENFVPEQIGDAWDWIKYEYKGFEPGWSTDRGHIVAAEWAYLDSPGMRVYGPVYAREYETLGRGADTVRTPAEVGKHYWEHLRGEAPSPTSRRGSRF
jgi:hypothetical protein